MIEILLLISYQNITQFDGSCIPQKLLNLQSVNIDTQHNQTLSLHQANFNNFIVIN